MAHRVTFYAAGAASLLAIMLAPVEGGVARQNPPSPPRTGTLMMAQGNPDGTVVYAKPVDVVFRAATQVAAVQGTVVQADADAGTLRATIQTAGAAGARVDMSVTVSKTPDGRVQVLVSPSGADYPAAATATRFYVSALTTAVSGRPVRAKACVFTDESQQASLRNRREAVKDLRRGDRQVRARHRRAGGKRHGQVVVRGRADV